LGITADQYPIVHDNLFAAIVEVLGEETVTDDVAAAWDRVYWIMADTLIDIERNLYSAAGVSAGDVYRRARVVSRVDDPAGAVLLTVRSLAEPFGNYTPGQYVSVGITLPDGARQLRQYSLISAPSSNQLTFAVKPVGEVSTWISKNVCVGDILDVTVPFGDLPTPAPGLPVVLISAGIGITPMIGILEYLAHEAPETAVQILHADRSDQAHPLRERQHELLGQLPNASLDVWYEDGLIAGRPGAHPGRLTLDGVRIPDGAAVYLCGNTGFVQAVRAQLVDKGVPAASVHCELFSPNDWLV
jgi:nitric oxide dioxygenase